MNKKKIISAVVAAALSAACCGTVLVGCNNAKEYVFEYEISVVGGTGGGTVKDGESCTVSADIPEGKVFDKWVNEYGEVLSTVNPYTFTVNGDMEIRAVVSDAETCKVEVVGGTITGTSDYAINAFKGQTVSVTAHSSQSHKFVKWIINGSEESTSNPYVFTAVGDIKLEAVIDESYLVAVSGGTIGDGSGEETRKIFRGGDECTITAGESADGSVFVYWYVIDENENEVRVAYTETYTFTVTGTDKYYAKYGKKFNVSVVGGTVDGFTEISVMEGENATVTLDTENFPADKGFVGWTVNGVLASSDFTYTIRGISEDIEVVAKLDDRVHDFATPGNANNEMFRFNASYTVEFDRNGDKSHTEFVDNVEYIMYYFYESPYADKDDYVGRIKLVRGSDKKDNAGNPFGARFETLDGTEILGVKGALGDLYQDYPEIGGSKKATLFAILKAAIGGNYDADTPYYVAAQTCGKDYSIYAPSDISVIGPMAFVEGTAPARYTVTVVGGKFKNVGLDEVTMYAGQKITVVCDSDQFKGWIINGDSSNIVSANPYTLTVSGNTTVEAAYEGQSTVTVHNGTIKDSGATSGNYEAGERVTVVADPAEIGKVFAYWYTLDGGVEKKLAETAEYTFGVTTSIDLYVKYSNTYTLTVRGGILDGADKTDNGEYTVVETSAYTVKLDPSAIPSGKGFTGWKIGEDIVSTAYEYAFAAGAITADTTIEATYGDLVHDFVPPKMDNNESFRPRRQNADDYVLEMARGGKFFDNVNVQYIKFYIYESRYADKDDYVGVFKIDNSGGFRIATADGETLWYIEGSDGNFWLDTKNGYNVPSTKSNCRNMFARILGAAFDENMPYYIAAQACGKDYSVYAPSDISAIGPKEFFFGSAAKYSVTVNGGNIKNTELTTVTMYAGQKVTVVCDSADFKCWLVNGEIVQGAGSTYTFTVSENVTLNAVLDGAVTVTVSGGTVNGGDSATVESGSTVTVIADTPEQGKIFEGWYALVGGVKTKLSGDAEYTFVADSDIELTAEFSTAFTLTIAGGTLDGAEKSDNGKYIVKEGVAYTVRLDLSAIPSGKGFTGWKIGEDIVSTAYEYAFAAGAITADTTIEAMYADQVREFAKPVNDNNQMFSYNASYTMEIDRKNKGVQSEFDNPNIEYMMFYFYTTPFAANTAENAVGSVKLVRTVSGNSESFYFAKLDGTKIWDVKGKKSDLYQDETCGQPSKKDAMFLLVKSGVADYDPNTPYYIAVQSFGKAGSIYAPSEISAIGPQALIYNNVVKYTVTIDGGAVKNTTLTSVSLYSGQSVTVVPTKDLFEYWLVNGTTIADPEYTFTVTDNITVKAIYGGESTVTVSGGKINDAAGETEATVSNGSEITVVANEAAENTVFVYWYKLDGDAEVILSRENTYTFTVLENTSVYAKFGNLYKLTVTGGSIDGLTAVDGSYTVMEYNEYVLRLSLSGIPEGKSFANWSIGDESISSNYVHKFAPGYFKNDASVVAMYAETTALDVSLSMASGTEMIRRTDSYVLDIDRCFSKPDTAFKANVDHVKLYIYTSADAAIDDYVGILVVDLKGNNGSARFATADGTTLWHLEGSAGNYWIDTKDGYNNDRRGNFRKFLRQCIGGRYSEDQSYYFAAQACGDHETYGDGAISGIGSQAF